MKTVAMLVRAWRILTWKHWAWAAAIAVLVGVSKPLQGFDTNRYWAHWQVLYDMPWLLVIAGIFLVAIALVESSVPDVPGPSAWRYVAAITVASVACVAIAGSLYDYFQRAPHQVTAGQTLKKRTHASPEARVEWQKAAAMKDVTSMVIYGWLATFIYVSLRKSRRATQTLNDAEMGRSEAQRTLLAAQLLAAHAEVDPVFVLERLEAIEQAYEADPAGADAQLDELIAFLRAAIPRLRSEEMVANPP
jgi:hypothetical protein